MQRKLVAIDYPSFTNVIANGGDESYSSGGAAAALLARHALPLICSASKPLVSATVAENHLGNTQFVFYPGENV
ncbi:hypothetical protein NPIL_701301 [Nephila pilipes]|uniref:Uncharacterized protein n=1 Tax=Nephila pilipes TaxID=299642 RepID=A0A8X6MXM8_NEPPI|nr:hypothetical protein NPIL_701301 [Nephila pilipes]